MPETSIKSLYEHIAKLANEQPKKIALVGTDEKGNATEEITYAQLLANLEAAAAELRAMSLQKGDRIALAFRNSPALLIWSWAAWASGIVTVPMDTKRDTPELYEYKINLNKAKALIFQRGIQTEKLPGVRFKVHTEFSSEGGSASGGETEVPVQWEKGLDHQALVLFTSGTTGHPKGAMLSLKNLIVNAEGIREWLRFTQEDVFLVNLPLHHINSTTFCLSALLAGARIAVPPNYSNSHFWQQAAKTGATISSVVQSIVFDQLHRESEFAALKGKIHLTRIQIGSAPVIAQSVVDFQEKFGIRLYQGYGQTETALRVTGVPMDISNAFYEQLVEANSIGEAMKWADLQIADEQGKFLGEGEEGELVVKGPAVMEGYLGMEPAFRDGYFLTGDIGYFKTVEGRKYYYLKGRKREIIIKGGINISPVAVENALKKMSPEIDQVHVVAVPDERYGEEAGAVISWAEGIDEERAKRQLKTALLWGTPFLSAYETPKYITSMSVKELPMTSTGKVQRSILKQQLPYERFESIYGLLKTPDYRFTVLHRFSRWSAASYALHRQCWGDLAGSEEAYQKSKLITVLAARSDDSLAGQIAMLRTSLTEKELLSKTYDQLLAEGYDRDGNTLVCMSICSADYKRKPIPEVAKVPTPEEVRQYLEGGNDPVMRFHKKSKGNEGGAELIDVIENGRPTDKSSLGYTMLLKYPEPNEATDMTYTAPLSNQLIELVLVVARDLGIKNVYAYSRPGGLAQYLASR